MFVYVRFTYALGMATHPQTDIESTILLILLYVSYKQGGNLGGNRTRRDNSSLLILLPPKFLSHFPASRSQPIYTKLW